MVVNNKNKLVGVNWADALRESKRQIAVAQARIRQLRNSIRIIERKIADGEPWPESGVFGQNR